MGVSNRTHRAKCALILQFRQGREGLWGPHSAQQLSSSITELLRASPSIPGGAKSSGSRKQDRSTSFSHKQANRLGFGWEWAGHMKAPGMGVGNRARQRGGFQGREERMALFRSRAQHVLTSLGSTIHRWLMAWAHHTRRSTLRVFLHPHMATNSSVITYPEMIHLLKRHLFLEGLLF